MSNKIKIIINVVLLFIAFMILVVPIIFFGIIFSLSKLIFRTLLSFLENWNDYIQRM